MLLAIDIGNTNIVVGIFDGEMLFGQWRMATDLRKTVDEYCSEIRNFCALRSIDQKKITEAIISSVVPPLNEIMADALTGGFNIKPKFVTAESIKSLKIKVENPGEVGADRLVNAVAAYKLYGGPLIIVDFGTATTFCAVSEAGEYLGGAIAPGIGISRDALYEKTAKLPRIEIAEPKEVIGRNTISAMQSGLFYGYRGLVEAMINRFREEMGPRAKVVATGGLCELICKKTKAIEIINPVLTLEGLRLIHQARGG